MSQLAITSRDNLTWQTGESLPLDSARRRLLCTCEPRPGLFSSWRDGVMVLLEGGSAGAAFVALPYSLPLSGFLFALSVVTCATHACWRRDARVADMSRVAERLGKDNEQLKKTIVKVEEVGVQIHTNIKELHDEKEGLSAENQILEVVEHALENQNSQLKVTNQSLKDTNRELRDHINALQYQIKQVKGLFTAVKDQIEHYREQNDKLRGNITYFSKQNSRKENIESQLKKLLLNFDVEWQDEISQLIIHIAALQKSYEEIFEIFNKKNGELASEIEQATSVIARFETADRQMGQKTQKLLELEKQTANAQMQIERVHKEFMEVSQDLQKAKKELMNEMQQYAGLQQGLHRNQSRLTHVGESLSAVEVRIRTDILRLEELFKASGQTTLSLDEQLREIQKL